MTVHGVALVGEHAAIRAALGRLGFEPVHPELQRDVAAVVFVPGEHVASDWAWGLPVPTIAIAEESPPPHATVFDHVVARGRELAEAWAAAGARGVLIVEDDDDDDPADPGYWEAVLQPLLAVALRPGRHGTVLPALPVGWYPDVRGHITRWPEEFLAGVAPGLRQLLHPEPLPALPEPPVGAPTVLYLGVHQRNAPWGSEGAIARGLACHAHLHLVDFRAEADRLRRDVRALVADADLCLLQSGIGLDRDVLDQLDLPLCFFATEAPRASVADHLELITRRRPELVIAHDRTVHRRCDQLDVPVRRVMHGFDDRYYRPVELPRAFDVAFVGRLTPRREQAVETLRRRAPELRVTALECTDPRLVARVYNASRLVLHVMAEDGVAYLPTRLFEVLPTRAGLLCEAVGERLPSDLDAAAAMFPAGDWDAMANLARELIADERWRGLAAAGNATADRHSWQARAALFWGWMQAELLR